MKKLWLNLCMCHSDESRKCHGDNKPLNAEQVLYSKWYTGEHKL